MNKDPQTYTRIEICLSTIKQLLETYDLAGAICLVSEDEMHRTYVPYARWNAVYYDPKLPMGIRIKANADEEGSREAADAKLAAALHVFHSIADFGAMTHKWFTDFVNLMAEQGVSIDHAPWDGQEHGTVRAIDADTLELLMRDKSVESSETSC